MESLLGILRSGDWLTGERMRVWPLGVLAISIVAIIYVIATSDGLNDYQGRPLGSDFSNVYAAGSLVREGRAEAAFDWPLHHAREKTIFGEQTPFYGWHYPPIFLFVAGALATMSYQTALAVWQGVTLVLYLIAIYAILSASGPPHPTAQGAVDLSPTGRGEGSKLAQNSIWLLLALAFPAVLINLGHGQNGFLTAALIGGALVLLDRRPIVAGILFGLMAYKPQFGFMIPLVLIASGRWRAFAAAAATVAALVIATTLVFGSDVWSAFFDTLHLSRTVVLEGGNTGWQKIQSVFSWVRSWGGGVTLAYAVHGAVTLAVAGALIWLWRSDAAYPLKAAALAIGTILATPYSLDYDLMVLAPAIAYLAAYGMTRGFGPWEISALALMWFMPLFTRSFAEYALIPIGVWTMLAVFALVARRGAYEARILAR